jgi:hypothetical protein
VGALTAATLGFFIVAWRFTRLAVETESDSVWQRFARINKAYWGALVAILGVEAYPAVASFLSNVGRVLGGVV